MLNFSDYCSRLSTALGQGWNRFWFQQSDPAPLAMLRIALGVISLVYVLSFTGSLATWFANDGILPLARTYHLTGADNPEARVWYWSLFYATESPAGLWILHGVSLAAILGFTLGIASRWTGIATLVFVISYAQRAPVLTGLVEPLLCPLLLYVVLAPCGAYYSVDAWWRARKGKGSEGVAPSSLAHIALRLAQVHLSMFYLMLGLSKLASFTWWNGEAMWYLIAQTETRLIDLTFLRDAEVLVAAWTHFIVLFELLFGLLCWVKLARPLLAVVSVPHWVLLGLVTGQWQFALLMICANLAFVPWEALRGDRPAELPGVAESIPAGESPRGVAV